MENTRMKLRSGRLPILAGALLALGGIAPATGQAGEPAAFAVPQPGVPEVVSVKGKFIRVAYNDEGFVVLGFMSPNRALGGEWMLLDFGATLLDRTPDSTLSRDAITLETPDGRTISMASVTEQRGGATEALQWRATRENPAIGYFPTFARQPCSIPFFYDELSPGLPVGEVELSAHRGCYGRIFFRVPGGIALGQHWLNVKFAESVVRVPFAVFSAEEESYLEANLRAVQKRVEEAFPPTR